MSLGGGSLLVTGAAPANVSVRPIFADSDETFRERGSILKDAAFSRLQG